MAGKRRYSDILADILGRKHSNCTCPPEFFSSSLKPKKPNPNTEGCQFGPDCQFVACGDDVPVSCQYNRAKCTCFSQCICGPQPELPVQLIQGPELDQIIGKQMCICGPQPEQSMKLPQSPECICGGNCYCESEDTFTPKNIYRPTPDCDKTRCICNVCLCQPGASDTRLLPTDFRNAVKKEPQLSTDERIKQECAEIKQLLIEHEESVKKELEEATNFTSEKLYKKPVVQKVSIVEDSVPPIQQGDIKEDTRDSILLQEEFKSSKMSVKNVTKDSAGTIRTKKELKESIGTIKSKKEPKESTGTIKSKKEPKESAGTIKSKRLSKKEKTPKRKSKQIKSTAIKSKPATPSQFTQYSCGCRMPKKKPLHIRYYFSGGTEQYGVRLGHKQCMPKPANVPKNMGWLWNIEDPSKGIRERKGWPPGFIAKNIKNMIKVLKQFDDPADPGLKGMVGATPPAGGGRRFGFRRREEGEVGTEPQEEPPLLHIHKKGRTYNITFCPKSSDTDIGPIPIPFSITEKKHDSDSSSSDSTLEFEFHSPKPRRPQLQVAPQELEEKDPEEEPEPTETTAPPPSTSKATKKKPNKKRSVKSTDENKILWEEQQTQIENIA